MHRIVDDDDEKLIPQDNQEVYLLNPEANFRSIAKVPNAFEDLENETLSDIPAMYKLIYLANDTYSSTWQRVKYILIVDLESTEKYFI